MSIFINFLSIFLCSSLLFLSACNSSEITSYYIPKEEPPILASTRDPLHDHLAWKAPSHWISQPASGMRLATYRISESNQTAEVSIVSISGQAGDLLSNLNRWRGQLQLDPIKKEALSDYHREVSIGNLNFQLFKLSSKVPLPGHSDRSGMSVAMLKFKEHHYFFKLVGPLEIVKSNIPSLMNLLESVTVK